VCLASRYLGDGMLDCRLAINCAGMQSTFSSMYIALGILV
jgi:hypothetical protein